MVIQDGLVSTEAWVQPGRYEVRILTGARDFLSENVQKGSRAHPASRSMGNGAPLPGSKGSRVDVKCKPHSIAKVKNEWGCTSSPCIHFHGSEICFTQFGHICKILFLLFLPFLW